MKLCPYREVNFAKEKLCILDPDHMAMDKKDFDEFVKESIEKYPEIEREKAKNTGINTMRKSAA